jgi:hypothetical protein
MKSVEALRICFASGATPVDWACAAIETIARAAMAQHRPSPTVRGLRKVVFLNLFPVSDRGIRSE